MAVFISVPLTDVCDAREAGPILIGALWDLSGARGEEGRAAFMAARRAVEVLNTQGGIRGRRLELVVSDTQGQPGILLAEIRTLVRQEGVVVLLGPTHEAMVSALRRSAEHSMVPVVLTAGDDELVPGRGGEPFQWNFSVSPNLGAQLKALYRYLSKTKLDPLAPLVADTPGGKRAALWIRAYGPEFGIRVLPTRSFGIDDADAVSQMRSFVGEGGGLIAIWGPRGCGPVIARSASESGATVVVPASILSDAMLREVTPRTDLWAILPPLLHAGGSASACPCVFAVSRFLDALQGEKERFSVEALLAAGAAWDAVHLTASALRAVRIVTPARLRQALEDLAAPYYGVGGIFTPSKRDHSGLDPESLLVLRRSNGQWVPPASERGR